MEHRLIYIYFGHYSYENSKKEIEELLNTGWKIVRVDQSISTTTLPANYKTERSSDGGLYYILSKTEE